MLTFEYETSKAVHTGYYPPKSSIKDFNVITHNIFIKIAPGEGDGYTMDKEKQLGSLP